MIRIDDLKWDAAGLIPAVVQDASTGEVLTVAWLSRESLEKTKELGETVFFSRSRRVLWHKGETSGNYQKVVTVVADCDLDSVVISVNPQGPACHTGARSCFFEQVEGFAVDTQDSIGAVLGDLERLIAQRKADMPEGSYTTELFEKGRRRIFQRVGEEAIETAIAGSGSDREELIREVSDLIYHILVGLRESDISLSEIARELRSRRR